jgi:hypothetical protein
LGFTIRTPSWKNDFGPCDEHAFPCLGLDLGVEFLGCSGCELALAREVRSAYLLDGFFMMYFCRPPIVQTSSKNTTIFVWVTLAIAFIAYARFVYLVIWDITNYLGIACFTVQKKDKEGKWHSAQPNAKRQ